MYPAEPRSAAAFMNSPSSWRNVSAVAFPDVETSGRVLGTAIIAINAAETTTITNDFM
jgi:hypothetical protein